MFILEIRLDGIKKKYRRDKRELIVLENLDMYLPEGKFVVISGDSGVGKSTLLNIISGLSRPTKGKVFYDEKEITGLVDKELSDIRKKYLGVVTQNCELIPYLTVLENLKLAYEIERVQHTGGTLSADQTTVEGTIEAPDTRYYNQFTNRKVTESEAVRVELKVKKVVEDYTWGQEYYRFTLSAGEASYTDTEGGTGTSPMPDGTQNSAVSIYNSTAEHTLSFGTVRYTRPGTYTYTVSEYDNSRNMPDVQFASPVTITVTVTADDSGKLVVENVEDDQGTTVYSAETGSALAAGLTTQTNTTKKIHIRKVDKNNPNTVLADAVFEIRSGGEKMYLQDGKLLNAEAVQEIIGMPVSAVGAEAAMASEKISSTFTLGEIDISGFSYDVVYELKEITPPDGYIIVNGSTYFKAVHNNTQTYLRLTDQNGTVLADDDNNPILENDYAAVSENGLSISVKNEPGVALPNTGGPGSHLFIILGTMLTVLAAGGLVWMRKRKGTVSCQ